MEAEARARAPDQGVGHGCEGEDFLIDPLEVRPATDVAVEAREVVAHERIAWEALHGLFGRLDGLTHARVLVERRQLGPHRTSRQVEGKQAVVADPVEAWLVGPKVDGALREVERARPFDPAGEQVNGEGEVGLGLVGRELQGPLRRGLGLLETLLAAVPPAQQPLAVDPRHDGQTLRIRRLLFDRLAGDFLREAKILGNRIQAIEEGGRPLELGPARPVAGGGGRRSGGRVLPGTGRRVRSRRGSRGDHGRGARIRGRRQKRSFPGQDESGDRGGEGRRSDGDSPTARPPRAG